MQPIPLYCKRFIYKPNQTKKEIDEWTQILDEMWDVTWGAEQTNKKKTWKILRFWGKQILHGFKQKANAEREKRRKAKRQQQQLQNDDRNFSLQYSWIF